MAGDERQQGAGRARPATRLRDPTSARGARLAPLSCRAAHALPPARSVSRMMCVMPALKPMNAVRWHGLEGSSLGNLCTVGRDAACQPRHIATHAVARPEHPVRQREQEADKEPGPPAGRPTGFPPEPRSEHGHAQTHASRPAPASPGASHAPFPCCRCDRFLGRKPREPHRGSVGEQAQRKQASAPLSSPRSAETRSTWSEPAGRRTFKLLVRHCGLLHAFPRRELAFCPLPRWHLVVALPSPGRTR